MKLESIGVVNSTKSNYVAFGNKVTSQLNSEIGTMGDSVAFAKTAKPMSAMRKFAYRGLMFLAAIPAFIGCSKSSGVNPEPEMPKTTLELFNSTASDVMGADVAAGDILAKTSVKNVTDDTYLDWEVTRVTPKKDTVDLAITVKDYDKSILGTAKSRLFAKDGKLVAQTIDKSGRVVSTGGFVKSGVATIEEAQGSAINSFTKNGKQVLKKSLKTGAESIIENLGTTVKHL